MIEILDRIQYFPINNPTEFTINNIINRIIQTRMGILSRQLLQIEIVDPKDGATLLVQGRLTLASTSIRDMITFQLAPSSNDSINSQIEAAVNNFYEVQ